MTLSLQLERPVREVMLESVQWLVRRGLGSAQVLALVGVAVLAGAA